MRSVSYLVKSVVLASLAATLSISCSSDFDTTRRTTEPVGTLGDDLYSALCDRVGASVLTEDLSGASYRGVCHRDKFGSYADSVDESKLPPVAGNSAFARTLAVAKLNAMVRRRGDLILALNKTFSDDPIPVPFGQPGETINGHAALDQFLKRIAPLYDGNPIDHEGSGAREGLMPSVTRSVGRLFAALGGPGSDPISSIGDTQKAQAAQLALSRLSGRLGYRPLRVALGAMRPSLAYPELRQLAQTFTPKLRPGGNLRSGFQNVLGMAQNELTTSEQKALPLPFDGPVNVEFPQRPRTNTEIAQAIMLATDPAFAGPASTPRWLVVRDTRGYAVPAGNTPGTAGSVPAPFFDGDNDGFADVDELGRFLSGPGTLAPVDTPFVVPGVPRQFPADAFGRALGSNGQPLYAYLNTSETFMASTMRDLDPLLDVDGGNESIADLLSGAYMLYGPPIQVPATWAEGGVYPSFDTQSSPIVNLLYATGWILAHKNSDVQLKFLRTLFAEHEQVVARVIGAALKVREVSNAHPEAKLDPSDTFWDEMAEFVANMSKDANLTKDLLRSLADPNVQAYLGTAYGNYNRYKDFLTYDSKNLNGTPINLTTGGTADPSVPPDYSQPDAGDNRSEFARILQIIHDVNDVNACNKPGAKVRIKLGIPITWPAGSGYKECELFVFKNMGLFYLDSILGQAKLDIRPDTLKLMMDVAGIFTDPDAVFQTSSGITGMGLSPTPQALNRLVYFGAETSKFDPLFSGGKLPDRDANFNGSNGDTNKFISSMVDAISPAVCPERAVQDPRPPPNLGTIWVSDCSPNVKWAHSGQAGNPQDLLRVRDKGTIFTWEKYEFYKAMKPILQAFKSNGQAQLFLDHIEILYRHWATEAHGPECNSDGDFSQRPWEKYLSDADRAAHKVNPAYNPRYCTGSGLSRYEPILAEAFQGDLIPALGELVTTVDAMTIKDRNGVDHKGLDILHEMTQAMFDPDYAASVGMRDRFGNKTTKWANGLITKPQLTPFDLFADALKGIDQALDGNPRQDRWRSARSHLVDQFLGVEGSGPSAHFVNEGFAKSVPILVDVLRAQLNANCPDRETNPISCKWATKDLADKAADTLGGPMFSTAMTLIDQINEDPAARQALEKHLRYLVRLASQNDALSSTLASGSDMMQILGDDVNMPLIYNAIALAAAPENATLDGKPAPGTADRVLEMMDALTKETDASGAPAQNPYDPYRVLDTILVNLVTPMDASNPESQTPLEVFLDTIAEVNRYDASQPREQPMTPQDLQLTFATLRDFMTGPTRGMEQFYEIMSHRDGN
ncbi:MAG: hypothetical protein KC776_05960 [Myxococcales bacterium]|nr:hypothetical protein [Myxococcales bacterium]MCB9575812.1 hypothetical protein [Polyangiaceae bacterium]